MGDKKMETYDVVIIGGGPAGVTCAISAHSTYPDKRIAVIRKEKIALIPCGIPYTLCSLSSVDDDILPDALLEKIGVELYVDEVKNKKDKVLALKSGRQIKYGKLVLATGSIPALPPIEGIDKTGVFWVEKDIEYLKSMKKYAEEIDNIVIIGGGYIGVEMADEALRAGKKITIIEMMDTLLATSMDPEFGGKASGIIKNAGGRVILGKKVSSIVGDHSVWGVKLENGKIIPAEMVILSVGSKPNVYLAKKFGLDYHPKHGILVNEYLSTSEEDVFAVGDCAIKYDFFTGEYSNIRLASTAMAEGRLAGSDLYQIKVIRKYNDVLGSFSTKVGDTAFGVSGITEEKAKMMNLRYTVGEADTVDRHPGKLPGSSKLHLKLIFSRYSHTLLGAEMYGGDSVGELVNMFAVMILNKMTDMDIDTLQIGTHPLLTASPIAYPVINATVDAIKKWYKYNPEIES